MPTFTQKERFWRIDGRDHGGQSRKGFEGFVSLSGYVLVPDAHPLFYLIIQILSCLPL